MSCYVVEHSVIDRILTCGKDLGLSILGFTLDEIGQNLLDLNQKAFRARYPHIVEESLPYKFRTRPDTPPGIYKAIECLLYQCSEGEAPKDPVYGLLEGAKEIVAAEIIHKLPAYDSAAW